MLYLGWRFLPSGHREKLESEEAIGAGANLEDALPIQRTASAGRLRVSQGYIYIYILFCVQSFYEERRKLKKR